MNAGYSDGKPKSEPPSFGLIVIIFSPLICAVLMFLGLRIEPADTGHKIEFVATAPDTEVKDYGVIQSVTNCAVRMQPRYRGSAVPIGYVCDVETDKVRMQGVDLTQLPGVEPGVLRDNFAGKRLTLKMERVRGVNFMNLRTQIDTYLACLDDDCKSIRVVNSSLAGILTGQAASPATASPDSKSAARNSVLP